MKNWIVEAGARIRLDRWLADQMPDRARNQIEQDIRAGRVRMNDRVVPSRTRVAEGDRIEYDWDETDPRTLRAEELPLNFVYEDDELVVIDKPAGLVVHPAPGHATGTVAGALLAHCGPSLEEVGGLNRWGIVHRLDKLTSGLMMAAKTPRAYEALVAALGRRAVSRRYLAVVIGHFKDDSGTIDRPIGRRHKDRKLMGVTPEGREARSSWRLIYQDHLLALLGMSLHTGRTHQIRVHLQSIGRPVLCDPDYGWTRPRTLHALPAEIRARLVAIWPGRQMLHAVRLAFDHPTEEGRRMDFASAPPEDMRGLLDAMFGDSWQSPLEEWLREPVELIPAVEADEDAEEQ